jgi:branched-chain amino acid transport system permease protein
VKGVSKNFGSFRALTDINLQVKLGELVSIVGPNGAGKTSLVRCISDGLERNTGSVSIDGYNIGNSPPDVVVGLGVGRKFQGASVFESLTGGECLRIASWKGSLPSLWGREITVRLPTQAVEVIEGLGLREVWNVPARDISHGQRQGLELAMVLALEPRIIVLDEPTAGLTSTERAAVGRLLRGLVSTGKLAVLLIEHDFEFVKEISTRIVVLHEGRILADGTVSEVAESKVVKDVYLGRVDAKVIR